MKRRAGILLSTISTAAVTAALAMPAPVRPVEASAPIHRLASIRQNYLATLAEAQWPQKLPDDADQVAQFRNFPNFSNWRNR
jgi:hypothetical protein